MASASTSTTTQRLPPQVEPPRSGGSSLVLAGDRSADVVAFERSMVDFFVDAAELLGVPKSVAAIYGIVFASPVPLSFADIESRLDISKGSVSQGLRVLREVEAVKEVSTDADKAELFVPETEMRSLAARFIRNRLEKQFATGKGRLREIHQGTSAFRNGQQKIIRQRVDKLQRWHDRSLALLPVIRTFLKIT